MAKKLQYTLDELAEYFSPEQVDAIALGIKNVDNHRGIINADQTGIGKGRYAAAMLRYARLQDKLPIFLTLTPDLFTDIYRDISDIGSDHLFKNPFIFNSGVNILEFGSEDKIKHKATSPLALRNAIATGEIDPEYDLVLASYSQFNKKFSSCPKAKLLAELASHNAVLMLDESHIAAGQSNTYANISRAIEDCDAVLYSSATALKGVDNFLIYRKVLPQSVDLNTLGETLAKGGEALQEAISTNMSRDGVLIRREHDFSKLEFHNVKWEKVDLDLNIELSDKLAEILSMMSIMSGDVKRTVSSLNKDYENASRQEGIDFKGSRLQASSMNFGSRLFNINRQFLLALKTRQALKEALRDLEEGRKPVIALENTGESLLQDVLNAQENVQEMKNELEELNNRFDTLSEEENERKKWLLTTIDQTLKDMVLERPPQFRDLLKFMLGRIGKIQISDGYGQSHIKSASSEEYLDMEKQVDKLIDNFPDLPLSPIDTLKDEFKKAGYQMAEVSGRRTSLNSFIDNDGQERWRVEISASKLNGVAQVAAFQNGRFDGIIITRAGSTGISLHSTDRYPDSDSRKRDFIGLQPAADIAQFIQWLGRVNRKGQVVAPRITNMDSGLPAERRLTMMHNAKLRKLSANIASNRESSDIQNQDNDLLNDLGDKVALNFLLENHLIAARLDISLPSEDESEKTYYFNSPQPYINKLLARLSLLTISEQEEIINVLTEGFNEKVAELEEAGIHPFKIALCDWKAKIVKRENLMNMSCSKSSFDAPVEYCELEYTETIYPLRSEQLLQRVADDSKQSEILNKIIAKLRSERENYILRGVSNDVLASETANGGRLDIESIIKKSLGAKKAAERVDWLIENLVGFKPGVPIQFNSLLNGEQVGYILNVYLPEKMKDIYSASKYWADVIFPGEEKPTRMSLSTIKFKQHELSLKDLANRKITPLELNEKKPSSYYSKLYLGEFDIAPEGKIVIKRKVLIGNIFRACEKAAAERLGSPIIYTDEHGERHRAVLLKSTVTLEKIKSLPIGLDANETLFYIKLFLKKHAGNLKYSNEHFANFQIQNTAGEELELGQGIILKLNADGNLHLYVPGSKIKAGNLLNDDSIFQTKNSNMDGLGLLLSGTRSMMSCVVTCDELEFLERLQKGHHVGKFYVVNPDLDILDEILEKKRDNETSPQNANETVFSI